MIVKYPTCQIPPFWDLLQSTDLHINQPKAGMMQQFEEACALYNSREELKKKGGLYIKFVESAKGWWVNTCNTTIHFRLNAAWRFSSVLFLTGGGAFRFEDDR